METLSTALIYPLRDMFVPIASVPLHVKRAPFRELFLRVYGQNH